MWLGQFLQLQGYRVRMVAVVHGEMGAAGEHIGQVALRGATDGHAQFYNSDPRAGESGHSR